MPAPSPPGALSIGIETITPLWTGDAHKKTSYLKATSLAGGLRFWAEALLRSLGMEVCDITDQNSRCIYDPEKKDKKICSACEVFGCTGKSRSFMLRVTDENLQKEKVESVRLVERAYYKNGKKNTPRYLDGNPGLSGTFTLQLSPVIPTGIPPVAAAALLLMLRWGALGARDQYGFGFCRAKSGEDKLLERALEFVSANQGNDVDVRDRASLRDFFFFSSEAEYRDRQRGNNQITSSHLPFIIRNDVRGRLRPDQAGNDVQGKALRHYFCGNVMGGSQGSHYNLALAGDRLYGWGWYPRRGRFSNERDRCLNDLKTELAIHSRNNSVKWKEFDAANRDNVGSSRNWHDFLTELLQTTWR